MTGMTHKGLVSQSYGGVGRNMADVLARLDCQPLFISALGHDQYSKSFWSDHEHMVSHLFFYFSKYFRI